MIAKQQHTAALLEQIRTLLGGAPVRVSSGYRCLALNRALRSADTSAHIRGQAADFVVPGFGSPLAACRFLASHQATLQFDPLIHEFGSWVHIGRRTRSPRGDLLTINNTGTQIGLFWRPRIVLQERRFWATSRPEARESCIVISQGRFRAARPRGADGGAMSPVSPRGRTTTDVRDDRPPEGGLWCNERPFT